MGNSPWEKRILQGITISLGPAILWVAWWPGRSCTLRQGQVLVFINRHHPTMNLVEEKQRGLIPPGLQSWPLQLIEYLANTIVLRHLLQVQRAAVLCTFSTCWIWVFTIRAPNGCCILQFKAYQSFVCNLLSTPRCESQVPSKETKSLSCFGRNIRDMLTTVHVLCDCYTKIFRGLKVIKVCWCRV